MGKKITENSNTDMESETADVFPSVDYIPYAFFLDKECLITKNGDLVTIFKVPNILLNNASQNGEKVNMFSIRDALRESIKSLYTKENITLYFTTVREKMSVALANKGIKYFESLINESWNKQNDWENQYVNELYVTIVISLTIKDKLTNPLYFLTSLTQTSVNSVYSKRINVARKFVKKLSKILEKGMSQFGLKVLTFSERDDGTLYSEQMNFLSLILNLEKIEYPVSYDEVAEVLRQKNIQFGIDMVQATDINGKRKFASIFTSKFSGNLSSDQIDKVIQLPISLVITETESLVDSKYATFLFEEQKKITKWSEDSDFSYYSNLDVLIDANNKKATDYSVGQTTFMLINESKDALNKDIRLIYKHFNEIGFVAVKETVYLPSIFYSQLPGNMRYLRRFSVVATTKIANWFSLYGFPIGSVRNNYWGDALTIIPTAIKTPYFFNFHNGNKGNTFILGKEGTGKTTILNFLLSQSLKYKPKIFYIDTKRNSEVFISAIGGEYYRVGPNLGEDEYKINPFLLEDSIENREFLNTLIIAMVDWQDDNFIDMGKDVTRLKEQYKNIDNILEQIANSEDKSFKSCIEKFNTQDTNIIYKSLQKYINDPQFSFLFSDTNTDMPTDIIGISLRTILTNPHTLTPFFMCILKNIDNYTNGEPFILVIDDCWQLINNIYIIGLFRRILFGAASKNMIVAITINTLPEQDEPVITGDFETFFSTEIFLSNPKATIYQKKVFLITEEESKILSIMDQTKRNFILKAENDIIIASLNLTELNSYLRILSNDNVAINTYKKALSISKSKDPEVWIPNFIKIIEEYERAVSLKKLREQEENQLKWEKANQDVGNSKNKIVVS
jgi:type IV secretion system protein VirB4